MSTPDFAIVIGGSAGALQPLKMILESLPSDLPAACFVVVHTSATGGRYLPSMIGRATGWDVQSVDAAQPLRAGHLYVPAPDRHLKITTAGVQGTRDAREHHMRPAVDVLFRSAARMFGGRTIAIVLSGYGGDGAGGALIVHARGGTVIVQDPADAEVASMPQRTLATGAVSHVLAASEIAAVIQQITCCVEAPEGQR